MFKEKITFYLILYFEIEFLEKNQVMALVKLRTYLVNLF